MHMGKKARRIILAKISTINPLLINLSSASSKSSTAEMAQLSSLASTTRPNSSTKSVVKERWSSTKTSFSSISSQKIPKTTKNCQWKPKNPSNRHQKATSFYLNSKRLINIFPRNSRAPPHGRARNWQQGKSAYLQIRRIAITKLSPKVSWWSILRMSTQALISIRILILIITALVALAAILLCQGFQRRQLTHLIIIVGVWG